MAGPPNRTGAARHLKTNPGGNGRRVSNPPLPEPAAEASASRPNCFASVKHPAGDVKVA